MFDNMPENLSMMPGYGYDYEKHDSHKLHHERLVKIIQDCEAICEHMTTLLKRKPDVHIRMRQLQLLRDCADICSLTAKYVARSSTFSKITVSLCARICEACGNECAKFPDMESQHCAHVCMNCARECQAYAMM